MRNTRRFSFLFVVGLILTLGMTSAALAAGGDKKKKKKAPKNAGIISVLTTPNALPVKIDGKMVGMSGTTEGAEFYLAPGIHLVEVEGPNGQKFSREINVIKKVKHCICLNIVEKTTSRPCPYDMRVDGPNSVKEGNRVTFVARNIAAVTPIAGTALNYAWKVSPSGVRIVSGLGSPALTIDTTGLGGRTLTVDVDVNDGVYDASCRQTKSISTGVVPLPPVKPPVPIPVDRFPFSAFDDDKARLDNLAIELQNNPSWQGYIIMYQGTDRKSQRTGDVAKLSRRALNYLVKTRGVDPKRIQIVRGGTKEVTTYEFWIVPPGAALPVPN
jgi:hypothetical protein